MIISIEQRKGKLIISYVNKEGGVSFMGIDIPRDQQYINVYSRWKSEGRGGIKSWDGKDVKRVPSEFLSRFRIYELFEDMAKEDTAPLWELNSPKMHFCDIEVNVDDESGFAEPEHAMQRINTISWCSWPNVIVFGLNPLSGEEIKKIGDNINNHLKPLGIEYQFLYKQFDNEANMLHDFLYNYAREAILISGWNFWNYDWRYMYNRSKKLGIDFSWMSPTKQWFKHRIMDRNKRVEIMLPQHKLIVDYMEIYKKWDRKIDPKENASLDFAAEAALGISKIKYPGSFQDLYIKDYDKYVFYNAIDSILVECIHNRLKTMDIFLALGNITRVEAMQAFSPIAMLEASICRYAYKRGMVFPQSKREGKRESYEGAFVFDPKPDLYPWVVSFDYASLYPSIMRQFKISIENFLFKDSSYQPKGKEIKCSSGAVFDSTVEPLLSEILTDYYSQRKESQEKAKELDIEINRLEEILKEREQASNLLE